MQCENGHPMTTVSLGGYHCPKCEQLMEGAKKHCLRLEGMRQWATKAWYRYYRAYRLYNRTRYDPLNGDSEDYE